MKDNFKQQVLAKIKDGMVFKNPGKDVSTIIKVSSEHITYMRGNSHIAVKLDTLYNAYNNFSGFTCSTLDLKKYNESVFSSKHNGHNCNCTSFFSLPYYLKCPVKSMVEEFVVTLFM